MTQYADRLANMTAAYDAAPMAGGVDDLPPDGEYQVIIDRFDFLESKKNGRLYLKTFATVIVGPEQGRVVTTLHDLEDQDRLPYLKRHLSTLEVEPASMADLEEALSAALDVPFLVAVKTSADGQYRNVYFNQKLGPKIPRNVPAPPVSYTPTQQSLQPPQPPTPASAVEPDIPF